MSLPIRLATMLTPLLVWGALYVASRLGSIPATRFTPWLKAGFVALIAISVILFALDHTHLSDVVAIHAWGLFGAQVWIARHHKQENQQEVVTSLKL